MKTITRAQAVAEVGEELVAKVQAEDVDFTNRVTDGTRHAGYTEFSASVRVPNPEGFDGQLTMYVFVPAELVQAAEDLSTIDWDRYIADAEYLIQ